MTEPIQLTPEQRTFLAEQLGKQFRPEHFPDGADLFRSLKATGLIELYLPSGFGWWIVSDLGKLSLAHAEAIERIARFGSTGRGDSHSANIVHQLAKVCMDQEVRIILLEQEVRRLSRG